MSPKKTIHLIGNAHLDPVWLWCWTEGVSEVLESLRAACDRLDEVPGFRYTRAESWSHQTVERLDPPTFERIKAHVESGRWVPTGGMLIQPDCNLPSGDSFRESLRRGLAYFESRFGKRPTIGYNVDSFGHAASLPSILKETGMRGYLFMRPGPHEMKLPSDLFRWRSPDGAEVLAHRLAAPYCTGNAERLKGSVERAVKRLEAADVPHTCCFFGVGNHGGGPTREQLAWIEEHRNEFPDVELIYSDPESFFDAIEPYRDELPVVDGELQFHAIGCYAVLREIKMTAARAEAALETASDCMKWIGPREEWKSWIDEAWERLIFNQFHDTYGGTSIPDACTQARDELGMAVHLATRVVEEAVRVHMLTLKRPDAPEESWRVAVVNPGDQDTSGQFGFTPWYSGPGNYRVADETGSPVPSQMTTTADRAGRARVRFQVDVPARGVRWLSVEKGRPESIAPQTKKPVVATPAVLETPVSRIGFDGTALGFQSLSLGETQLLAAPAVFEIWQDPTDTWSHDTDRYFKLPEGHFTLTDRRVSEKGPLRWTVLHRGNRDGSSAVLQMRYEAGSPWLELELDLDWVAQRKLLKWVIPTRLENTKRLDGVHGFALKRDCDGRETPFHGWTRVHGTVDGQMHTVSIVSPSLFSIDIEGGVIRPTLVRSPIYAHHVGPHSERQQHKEPLRHTDQGAHRFRFLLGVTKGEGPSPEQLEATLQAVRKPPVVVAPAVGMAAAHK